MPPWDPAAPLDLGLVPAFQPWLSFLQLLPNAEHPRELMEGEWEKGADEIPASKRLSIIPSKLIYKQRRQVLNQLITLLGFQIHLFTP